MAQFKAHKFVASLPEALDRDAVYFVRAGDGFDMYVTNSSGAVVSYALNKLANPMTARGDLIVGGSSGAPTRLPLGGPGTVLTVNAAGDGLEYRRPGGLINETVYSVPGSFTHTFNSAASVYEVEVWGGGASGGTRGNTADGGSSSFGTVGASGGQRQVSQGDGLSGPPGVGYGGSLNLRGSSGSTFISGFRVPGAPAPRGGGSSVIAGSGSIGAVGAGGSAIAGSVGGASGGYSFARREVGSPVAVVVGAGGAASGGGEAGGNGMVVVREYSASGPEPAGVVPPRKRSLVPTSLAAGVWSTAGAVIALARPIKPGDMLSLRMSYANASDGFTWDSALSVYTGKLALSAFQGVAVGDRAMMFTFGADGTTYKSLVAVSADGLSMTLRTATAMFIGGVTLWEVEE